MDKTINIDRDEIIDFFHIFSIYNDSFDFEQKEINFSVDASYFDMCLCGKLSKSSFEELFNIITSRQIVMNNRNLIGYITNRNINIKYEDYKKSDKSKKYEFTLKFIDDVFFDKLEKLENDGINDSIFYTLEINPKIINFEFKLNCSESDTIL